MHPETTGSTSELAVAYDTHGGAFRCSTYGRGDGTGNRMPPPLSMQRFIVEYPDQPKAGRTTDAHEVLPFLVAIEAVDRSVLSCNQ